MLEFDWWNGILEFSRFYQLILYCVLSTHRNIDPTHILDDLPAVVIPSLFSPMTLHVMQGSQDFGRRTVWCSKL